MIGLGVQHNWLIDPGAGYRSVREQTAQPFHVCRQLGFLGTRVARARKPCFVGSSLRAPSGFTVGHPLHFRSAEALSLCSCLPGQTLQIHPCQRKVLHNDKLHIFINIFACRGYISATC